MFCQSPNTSFKLRVRYKKVSEAAWISHLELLRSIEHAIRRSELPYAVTQGFSPHMKISFCSALSVGIESECQIFDVVLTEYVSPEQCLKQLKEASSVCLMPISCEYVDNKNSLAPVIGDVANYEIMIDKEIHDLSVPHTITIKKKGKEKTINLPDFLEGDPSFENRGNHTLV